MADLQLSISTVEDHNFGDHGDRRTTVHEYIPGETVEDLFHRVFPALNSEWRQHNAADKIVIKAVVGADGKVTGQVERPAKDGGLF